MKASGPFGICSGSVPGPFGVRSEPVQVRSGSVRGSFGVSSGFIQDLFGVRLGFVRGPFKLMWLMWRPRASVQTNGMLPSVCDELMAGP